MRKATDIINAYEKTSSVTTELLAAFRGARQLGLNFCRLDVEREADDLNQAVAVFLLSVCHGDMVEEFEFGCPIIKEEIKNAIKGSKKLTEDIDYLIQLMPTTIWE